MPGLNMEIIRNLIVPVPSITQQEQFATVVRRVEVIRANMGESERQAEGLFQSLLNEAFRG